MIKKYTLNGKTGVWRTVGGRRIFIKDGDSLSNAMKDSGKFNSDKEYKLTNENIQQVIDESISEWDDDYARLYLTKIKPEEFIQLTSNSNVLERLENEKFDLDVEVLKNKKYVADMMYLDIDLDTGEVRGHEGRHRMYALKNAGYKEVEIVVFPYNYEKYNAKEYNDKKIYPQEGIEGKSVNLKYLIPVSKRNKERILKREY